MLSREKSMPMFALSEAGCQSVCLTPNPRLRRYAPHLGLTMCDLSEVITMRLPNYAVVQFSFQPPISQIVTDSVKSEKSVV